MATVTINGTELDTDDPKAVRKALDKARREEKKASEARSKTCSLATDKAQTSGYRILCWKAENGDKCRGWRFYEPGDKWAPNLFKPIVDGEFDDGYKTRIFGTQDATLRHWGQRFMGAVCNGGGFAWLIFLQDETTRVVQCYAIGIVDEVIALAECPGISVDDFQRTPEENTY